MYPWIYIESIGTLQRSIDVNWKSVYAYYVIWKPIDAYRYLLQTNRYLYIPIRSLQISIDICLEPIEIVTSRH